jgi:hypothetical protein
LGVDTYYLAQKTVKSYYIERFDSYCEAARHNLPLLGVNHVEIIQGDCRDMLLSLPDVGCFYIDPARRGDANKRLFAINECEPDVLAMKTVLLEKATRLIIKVSPMADIVHTLQLLPETSQVHILSVRNECKELLFVLDRERSQQPNIYCINYRSDGTEDSFVFTLQQEHQTDIPISEKRQKISLRTECIHIESRCFSLCGPSVWSAETTCQQSSVYLQPITPRFSRKRI